MTEKLHKVVESIEDARMDGLKGFVKELKKEERDIKTSLRAVEDALDALKEFGAEVDAKDLLALAKQGRAELKAELKWIRQNKGRVDVQRSQLVEAETRGTSGVSKDMRKIVPVVQRQSEVA